MMFLVDILVEMKSFRDEFKFKFKFISLRSKNKITKINIQKNIFTTFPTYQNLKMLISESV